MSALDLDLDLLTAARTHWNMPDDIEPVWIKGEELIVGTITNYYDEQANVMRDSYGIERIKLVPVGRWVMGYGTESEVLAVQVVGDAIP